MGRRTESPAAPETGSERPPSGWRETGREGAGRTEGEVPTSTAVRAVIDLGPEALRCVDPLPPVLSLLSSLPELGEKQQEVYLILSELFFNGLDHGLLCIDSSLKETPDGFARFYEIRTERLAELQSGSIRMEISYRRCQPGGELSVAVEDSGPGFDHAGVEFPDFDDNLGTSGRGIPLVKSLCRELRFVGRGNRVEAVYVW